MTALVIDDSRMIRLAMAKVLRPLGFTVTEAEDGRAGLEALGRMAPPDVILVDWNMPEMTGLEFVKAVRAEPGGADLRIIMVTTESDMDRVMTAIEAGVTEYVMKPFTPEVIADKLAMAGVPTA